MKAQWNSVVYDDNQKQIPVERWGHKLLKVHDDIFLFGGYGGQQQGQGKYLNDLWRFNLEQNQWYRLVTTGQIPSKRSNYTIHFNGNHEEVILFGGGSDNRIRFNSVHRLDLKTLVWREIEPEIGEEAPWERTYHVSQLFQNYLIVFGGEGVANLDLNDVWAFDLNREKWIRLDPQGLAPTRRRFASSALVGSDFYVIAGCKDNYQLLGDMHKMSLLPLLQNKPSELKWVSQIQNNKLLKRWGHSTEVYHDKLYLFSGRVNSENDDSSFIEYDCDKKTLKLIQTAGKTPIPRRRHGSVLVENCYLIFGGFNERYFNDFFSLKLEETKDNSLIESTIKANNKDQFLRLIFRDQKRMSKSEKIIVSDQTHEQEIFTCKSTLEQYQYFNLLLKQTQLLRLPNLFTIQTFKIVHYSLLEGHLRLWKDITLEQCWEIGHCLSYFCCVKLLDELQAYLASKILEFNPIELLYLSHQLSLSKLREISIVSFLYSGNTASDFLKLCSRENYLLQQSNTLLQLILQQQKKLKFQLQQARLLQRSKNSISKTVQALKTIFATQPQKKEEEIKVVKSREEKTCMSFFRSCFNRLAGAMGHKLSGN